MLVLGKKTASALGTFLQASEKLIAKGSDEGVELSWFDGVVGFHVAPHLLLRLHCGFDFVGGVG